MYKSLFSIGLVLCISLLSACTPTKPYKTIVSPKLNTITENTVVIFPMVDSRNDIKVPNSAKAVIEAELRSNLSALGWKVEIGQKYKTFWDNQIDTYQQGEGLFDAHTGRFKKEIIEGIERKVLSRSGYSNAVGIFPVITVGKAQIYDGTASWNNTKESVSTLVYDIFSTTKVVSGHIQASSFFIRIHNHNQLLLENASGIELLGKVGMTAYLGSEYEEHKEKFQDKAKISNAIKTALKPFISATGKKL